MKIHLALPTPSPALTLLAIIVIGSATGVLWPVNSFLLEFLSGCIFTLFLIPIIACLVWTASTFLFFVGRPLINLFKFRTKKTSVQLHATLDAPAIVTARPARAEVAASKLIGVAVLLGVFALWFLLVQWAISAGQNPVIVLSGWAAAGCAGAGLGLRVIAGAYDNDDVGTFGFLVLIAGAVSTTLVLIGLFALI
jgi:hypothetical protein